MRLTVLLAAFGLVVSAATPVGTVTSSEGFNLSGTEVSTQAMPSWPVLAGDQIQTHSSAAMLRLTDGGRVIVNSNSRVVLEKAGGATRVKLLSGSLRYSVKSDSMFEIIANNASSRAAAYSNGIASINGSTGLIAEASSLGSAVFVPSPIFRPGPLNLPSAGQLTSSNGTGNVVSPGAGSLLPFASPRP